MVTELTSGGLRPVHTLYEYWCFLKLAEIMERVIGTPGTVARQMVRVQEGQWELSLAAGQVA